MNIISLAEQKRVMRLNTHFRARPSGSKVAVEWIGLLKPDYDSFTFTVKIEYIIGCSPKVKMIDPLVKDDAPHINKDSSLCLYYPLDPIDYIWTPDKYIAFTIVQWTVLWLACYDVWLYNPDKKWSGLEAPHGNYPGDKLTRY